MRILVSIWLGLQLGIAPASAEIEQCRFIQAKPDREACYARQEAALAAKRAPPKHAEDTKTLQSLQQMRRDDDEIYKSLHSICRGC